MMPLNVSRNSPSTLTGINVTIHADGRSADIIDSDELTLTDEQDTDTSLKKVVSSDVDKFKAEKLADVALQKAWSLSKVRKGQQRSLFYKE